MDVQEGQDTEATLDDAQGAVSRATAAAETNGAPELVGAAGSLQSAVDELRSDDDADDDQSNDDPDPPSSNANGTGSVELPPVMIDLSLNVEECRAISRMAARESDRLAKVRKQLVEDGLVAGVREVDQHIRIVSGIKAMVAVQFDAFTPTPIEREIEARAMSSAQREAARAPSVGELVRFPKGKPKAIEASIAASMNPGEFIVDVKGKGRAVVFKSKGDEWRVVGQKYSDGDERKLPQNFADVLKEGRATAPKQASSRSARGARGMRGARGGAPQQIGSTVAKVAGAAAGRKATTAGAPTKQRARATGERRETIKPKPRGRGGKKRS